MDNKIIELIKQYTIIDVSKRCNINEAKKILLEILYKRVKRGDHITSKGNNLQSNYFKIVK